jgi:A/G-specific adenine glycosylase
MSAKLPDGRQRGAIVRALGSWYDAHARDLPWRRSRDPYAIWVSEIMLQQTRVDTVIPYFERFLERFPDVVALATAPLEQVLQHWSGLGYYRRARQMHAAAGEIVERHGGDLPADVAALRQLTGVGRYTAGAVASIAFAIPAPLVDGNVIRVLSRLFGLEDDMRSTAAQALVWRHAEALVPKGRPGRFNQALMELGATVCTPRAPQCERCPLRRRCVARRDARQEQLPRLGKRAAPQARAMVAAVVHAPRGRVLLARRVLDGLYGGMWEPPMVSAQQARAALRDHGVPASAALRQRGTVVHVLSHRKLEVRVLGAALSRAARLPSEVPAPYETLAWCTPEQVPLSTLARKLLAQCPAST